MVIVHGAGSAKENHADFGRLCAANGWAAVVLRPARPRRRASDLMSPAAFPTSAGWRRCSARIDGVDARCVCARGSSMGGYLAIHAAATTESIAGRDRDLPRLRGGAARAASARAGSRCAPTSSALDAWLGEHDLREAVGGAGAEAADAPPRPRRRAGPERPGRRSSIAHAGDPAPRPDRARAAITAPSSTTRSCR